MKFHIRSVTTYADLVQVSPVTDNSPVCNVVNDDSLYNNIFVGMCDWAAGK